MTTKGLKPGFKVRYSDGRRDFDAVVIEVSSSQKAVIEALTDVDDTFNTRTKVNTYRKFMKIPSGPTEPPAAAPGTSFNFQVHKHGTLQFKKTFTTADEARTYFSIIGEWLWPYTDPIVIFDELDGKGVWDGFGKSEWRIIRI